MDNSKILKEYSPLLHSEKKQHKELPNAKKKTMHNMWYNYTR